MSWSLQIRNGDLVTSGGRLGTVTRQEKMIQDLKNWIMECMGTDPSHPSYGSLFNGGTTPDGTQYSGVVGTENVRLAQIEIQKDIRRIIREYQGRQLARAKHDRFTYERATLTAGEVILDVPFIGFEQNLDNLIVTVVIQTGDGQEVSLGIPVDDVALAQQLSQ
jgi:hypothetical protein